MEKNLITPPREILLEEHVNVLTKSDRICKKNFIRPKTCQHWRSSLNQIDYRLKSNLKQIYSNLNYIVPRIPLWRTVIDCKSTDLYQSQNRPGTDWYWTKNIPEFDWIRLKFLYRTENRLILDRTWIRSKTDW